MEVEDISVDTEIDGIDSKRAAILIGVSPRLLAAWRRSGRGPHYTGSGRNVRYAECDVRRFSILRRASTAARRNKAKGRVQIVSDADADAMIQWHYLRSISPQMRSLTKRLGMEFADCSQQVKLQLFSNPPPRQIARSTAIGCATRWALGRICAAISLEKSPVSYTRYNSHVAVEDGRDDIAALCRQIDVSEAISRAMRSLPYQERLVIELYFGLKGEPGLTDAGVAARLALSTASIVSIKASAMKRLRQPSRGLQAL